MKTKRKQLSAVLGIIACATLASAIAFAMFPTQRSVYADFTTRDAYIYEPQTTELTYFSEYDVIYKTTAVNQGNTTISVNPWEKTVKLRLSIETIGPFGLQFLGVNSDLYHIPGICLESDQISIYNRWMGGTSDGYTVSPVKNVYPTLKTVQLNSIYNVEYGFTNILTDDETPIIDGYGVYFKMTDLDDETVIEQNVVVAPNVKVEDSVEIIQDYSAATACNIGGLWNAEGNVFRFVGLDTHTVSEIKKDADISYFWTRTDNKPLEVIAEYCADTNVGDSCNYGYVAADGRWLAPEFDERVSFRFTPNSEDANGVYSFQLKGSLQWNERTFIVKLDFVNSKIVLHNGQWHAGKSFNYAFDRTKTYDIGLVLRSVYDTDGTTKITTGALIQLDVCETDGVNEIFISSYLSATARQDDVKDRLRIFPGYANNNPIVNADFSCVVSSITNEKWYDVQTVDNGVTVNLGKVSKVDLYEGTQEGKLFLGWRTGDLLYKAGEVVPQSNCTFTAVYLGYDTVQVASIRYASGTTGLRFKAQIDEADLAALKNSGIGFELCMGIERLSDNKQTKVDVSDEDLYAAATSGKKEFAVVITLGENEEDYYDVAYVAKALILLVYENGTGTAEQVGTAQYAINSAKNVATVVLGGDTSSYSQYQIGVLRRYAGIGTDNA